MARRTKSSEWRPAVRPLKIFGFDPQRGRGTGNRTTVKVRYEPLGPGPSGATVRVIDYDGARKGYYAPVDLDDERILIEGGLEPNEGDPRFHQQMVYAIVMKTIESFERALGRILTIRTGRHDALRVLPHAFEGRNAYYDPDLHALLFGYFRADEKNPGPNNLPGQTVFACLSHDIVAHETAHAIVHRLRPYFIEPTNPDVPAFHEAIADVVAIFQHFTLPDVLAEEIRLRGNDLRVSEILVGLAQQFGYSTGSGAALRSALGGAPDPSRYAATDEPHERGEILLAAIFDAYFALYERRTRDLLRIASGGTGRLPAGDLHPDLVARLAAEATSTARAMLSMCIRAIEYLPPVDVTFGDYLRALVTSDFDLYPDDVEGRRSAVISAFLARGIYPEGVISAAEESLLLGPPRRPIARPFDPRLIGILLQSESHPSTADVDSPGRGARPPPARAYDDDDDPAQVLRADFAAALHRFANANRDALELDAKAKISVRGFHPTFRMHESGRPVVEVVAWFIQRRKVADDLGGLPFRGGTAVVIGSDGVVRRMASKPLDRPADAAVAGGVLRLERQKRWLDECDARDPATPWLDDDQFRVRMSARASFAAVHAHRRASEAR